MECASDVDFRPIPAFARLSRRLQSLTLQSRTDIPQLDKPKGNSTICGFAWINIEVFLSLGMPLDFGEICRSRIDRALLADFAGFNQSEMAGEIRKAKWTFSSELHASDFVLTFDGNDGLSIVSPAGLRSPKITQRHLCNTAAGNLLLLRMAQQSSSNEMYAGVSNLRKSTNMKRARRPAGTGWKSRPTMDNRSCRWMSDLLRTEIPCLRRQPTSPVHCEK